MSTTPLQISDAAMRFGEEHSQSVSEDLRAMAAYTLACKAQLLLNSEREKWERDANEKRKLALVIEQERDEARREVERLNKEDWTASICDRVNEFLREHRVYDEVKDGQSCATAITYLHGHAGSLRSKKEELTTENQQLEARVLELEASLLLWKATFQRYDSVYANGGVIVRTVDVCGDYTKCNVTSPKDSLTHYQELERKAKALEWLEKNLNGYIPEEVYAISVEGEILNFRYEEGQSLLEAIEQAMKQSLN